MDLTQFLDTILHIDKMLGILIEEYGALVYAVLFAIIFCETAFVIFPFLPGDSLLFIAGTFSATGIINPWVIILLLITASISGNSVNYWIGNLTGSSVMEQERKWLDKNTLKKTQEFYKRHGGKTVMLARFIPVVRTFAPFVAGFSDMTHKTFQFFNVLGALAWVLSLVLAGYFFGNIPFVREHANIIVLVGVGIAIIPMVLVVLWKLNQELFRKI